MITVKYTLKDDDLLNMYRKQIKESGKSTIYPFVTQNMPFDDDATAIEFAMAKATATRVDGFKKSYEITNSDDGLIISVFDVASKKD